MHQEVQPVSQATVSIQLFQLQKKKKKGKGCISLFGLYSTNWSSLIESSRLEICVEAGETMSQNTCERPSHWWYSALFRAILSAIQPGSALLMTTVHQSLENRYVLCSFESE